MKQAHAYTAVLILAVLLAVVGCGRGEDGSESESGQEVAGPLEVPDNPDDNSGTRLMRQARMQMASPRGKMLAYMNLIQEKGGDATKSKAADLHKKFKSGMNTAQKLSLKMINTEGDTRASLIERYNDNWKRIQRLVGQTETLQMQVLGAG